MADAAPLLEVEGIETCYGLSQVLFGLSLKVRSGEMVALMGRNGMGKTTTVNAIMGLLPTRSGVVEFEGNRVDHLPSFRIARLGLGLVPEGRQIFPNLSVRENLLASAANRTSRGNPWTLERAYTFFPRLAERQRNMGNQLSGGEQQMLAIGRALMTNPRLLLMDEPSEGLAPVIVERISEVLTDLRRGGLGIFLVEQNYGLALGAADVIYILSKGQVVWQGTAGELAGAAAIRETHLGV